MLMNMVRLQTCLKCKRKKRVGVDELPLWGMRKNDLQEIKSDVRGEAVEN